MVMPADLDALSKEDRDALEQGRCSMRETIEAMLPENRLKVVLHENEILKTRIKDLEATDEDHGEVVFKALARASGAEAKVAELEKSLRFIERVDKTPTYGYKGTNADRDRHGQLPKKSGQRWKTPREIVRDLKLGAG